MPIRPNPQLAVPSWRNIDVKQRIAEAAKRVFWLYGSAVDERTIASAAHTNVMTLCKYYPAGAQELMFEHIETLRQSADGIWQELAEDDPDDPLAQLRGFIGIAASFANSSSDSHRQLMRMAEQRYTLTKPKDPLMAPLQAWRRSEYRKILELCRRAALREPEQVAQQLVVLIDGVRANRACFNDYHVQKAMISACESVLLAHGEKPAPPEREV
jgi:hypothetical protein